MVITNCAKNFATDNFSEKELQQIAKVLDCDYKSSFVIHETGEEI